MPYSDKQRKAAFAELNRRAHGGKAQNFEGMTSQELMDYAHSPLENKKKRGKKS